MWWPSAALPRRPGERAAPGRAAARILRLAVAGLLLGGTAAVLGGCGFRPLYGQSAADPGVTDELASVEIAPLRDRQGQLIHNALLTNLQPQGQAPHARYRLEVRYSIIEGQQALRTDSTATRDVLFYTITYFLVEGQNRVTTGSFTQVYSYDFLEEHYANISAQEDIQKRAATTIALEIKNRLAAYFTKAAEMKAAAAAAAAKPQATPQ